MSIKKIAELTGTSPSTVSRVLNNPNYKCSIPGMREKIWRIAMELSYTPNEAARNLKKGTTKRPKENYYMDILITRMDGGHSDPFYEELLRVVESQIHEHSCILSRVWYNSLLSNDIKCKKANLDAVFKEMFEDTQESQVGLIIIGKCSEYAIRKIKLYYKKCLPHSNVWQTVQPQCYHQKLDRINNGQSCQTGF